MRPLVSVLMTAYNREKYIAEAIESVLAQTFTDFELVIVDDGSKDSTVEIARRYTNDRRVRVHVNENNLGDYPNRNRAAGEATGRYVKYVDADDMIYPHGLEVMVRCMEQFPQAALGVCQLDYRIDGRPYPLQLSPTEAYRKEFLETGLLGNSPLSAIIRTEAFRIVSGFSGTRYIGDTELWLKLAARFPVVIMPPGLAWWRSHSGQELKCENQNPMIAGERYLMAVAAVSSTVCPLNQPERAEAIRRLKLRQARRVLRLLASGQFNWAHAVRKGSSLSAAGLLIAFSPAAIPLTVVRDEP
jgi:glycosyltransferase involved in cell wall biosynthesis